MTRGRLILVNILIAILVAGSAYAVLTDEERYPFSPYPMYSDIDTDRSVQRLELLGLSMEDPPQEVPLIIMQQLPPWDDARLMKSFRTILRQRGHRPRLRTALNDLLHQYEAHRGAGRHQGVALRGLRLYWLHWKDVTSGNWDTKNPDQRSLVVEVFLDSSEDRK